MYNFTYYGLTLDCVPCLLMFNGDYIVYLFVVVLRQRKTRSGIVDAGVFGTVFTFGHCDNGFFAFHPRRRRRISSG
jgi:hypothetical protein